MILVLLTFTFYYLHGLLRSKAFYHRVVSLFLHQNTFGTLPNKVITTRTRVATGRDIN